MVLGLRIDGAAAKFDELLEEKQIPLHTGDVLVFYTDGITEAMNTESDLFGDARLSRIVEEHGHLDSGELRERILREIEAFVGTADQHDDMTMILDQDHPARRRRGGGVTAGLVVINANIHTVDPDRPRAQALAVAGEVIVAVGSNEDVRNLAGAETQVIDAGGRLVVPGFNDAHVHLVMGAEELVGVDLRPSRDEGDMARRLAQIRGHAAGRASGSPAATGTTRRGRAKALPTRDADRCGGAEPSRVRQASRRAHGARELAGHDAGGHHWRSASRRQAARSCATGTGGSPGSSRTPRWIS